MNKGLNNHFFSIRYSLLAALLLWAAQLSANDLQAEAFVADYDVLRNGSHVADSRFQLAQQNGSWVWKMQTRPRGLYRWLTRKKPFTETRMNVSANGLVLSQISSGDYPDRPPRQSTWFDQARNTIFFTDSASGTPTQLELPASLYSYHSVHLLYRDMLKNGVAQLEIDFYKKGRLHKSTLSLQKNVPIPTASTAMTGDKVTHQVTGSNKTMVYYYKEHPLAPMLIQQVKNGKVNNEMRRSRLQ